MQLEENIHVSFSELLQRKFRSFLSMLGVIFGVAAVIAMLSVGEGAKQSAIAKYKELGVNNIIIRDKNLSDEGLEETRAKFSQGLSIADANAIREIIPSVLDVAPQTEKDTEAKYEDKSGKASIIGITPNIKNILNYSAEKGIFINEDHYDRKLKVCVLGSSIAKQLFPFEEPIGKSIKVEDQWLEVIGVMRNKSLFTETVGELASRDLNNDIYIPLTTFNSRFIKENELESEIKQITIRAENSQCLFEVAAVIKNLLIRRHFENDDYSIIIPYELLKQEEKERRIYNFLLGSIAAISLLVGGIGIMNIMLATVMERTREIGIKRAIGARKKDILTQFLTEAMIISITGGFIGVFFGLSISLSISLVTDVNTNVTVYSVFISFFVSVIVGIISGFLPAKKASELEPIEALRYE
ncbi:ABC transporter permease [bacterium]|nr:ABC transporter permease [bacterium]